VIRVLAVSAIGVVLLVVTALLVLHTNPVQARLLQWSVSELERRFDLDLTADDLHFNLLARRVVMTNVRLAAVGHHGDPFFSAASVTVRLPWAAYRGRLRFDEIGVDAGHVTITRDVNGVSNLPPGRGRRDPNAPARRIDARGLVVRSLDFSYVDLQRDIEIRTPQIRTDLVYEAGKGATGPFAIERELLVRVRQRRVTIKPVRGTMAFDASNVGLEDVSLETSEGRFTMAGSIDRALDRPTLNLAFKGTADIAKGAQWAPPPVLVAGEAAIEATMTGAPSAFVLDAHVVSTNAQVGRERGVKIDAQARLTPSAIVVSRSTIAPATGGEVQATAEVPFGRQSPWQVDAQWKGLDAASGFRLSGVEPLAFGAALEGTARLGADPGKPFRLEVHNVSTPRTSRGTAPLQGQVEFFVEGDRWRANQTHRVGTTRVEGRIGGVWQRGAVARSTFGGDLVLSTADVGEALRDAALFGLSSPAIAQRSRGPVDATATMAGTFTAPQFIGKARSDGLDVAGIGRAAVSADFDASRRAVNVTALDAAFVADGGALGKTCVTGEVLANLETRTFGGRLAIESPDISALAAGAPEALRLSGSLAATAILGGTVDAPDITADIRGANLSVAGQPIDSAVAKARVIDTAVVLESFTLQQGDGDLRGSGRYDWSSRQYAVDVTGQRLTWRGALPALAVDASTSELTAEFGLKFSGGGAVDRPTGEGVIEFEASGAGAAGELIDRGLVNLRLNGDTALVTGHVPSLGAFVSVTLDPRSPFPYDAVMVMNRIDLDPVVRLAGLRPGFVRGAASLSATASGVLSAPRESSVFINLQDVQADVSDVPVRLASPSRLAWDRTGLTIDALDLSVGQGRLAASGRLAGGGLGAARWESTFKGELGDLLRIARPLGVPTELAGYGPIDLVWQSTGGLEQSTGTMQLAGGSLGWATLPAVRNLSVDATLDAASLAVTKLTGQWQDGGLEGTASIPRVVLDGRGAAAADAPAGFAKLRIAGLSEEALAPWLSAAALARVDGRASATLDARIVRPSLEGVTATVTFDEADFSLAGVKVAQVDPSVLELENGLVTIKNLVFDAGGSPLSVTGTARIAPTDKQVLDLDVRGTADLRILSAFAPTIATDGEAKINIGIGGALRAPVLSGRVDVAGAEVLIREPRIVISELNGTIALDGKRLLFDGLTGSANGGVLTLDGGFLLEGFTPASGALTAQFQGAAFEFPEGLQSEADALLILRPEASTWSLTGEVRVERSVYNRSISLPALVAARRTRAPSAGGPESWGDRLRLNLFVFTQQDLRLDNNYGRLEAGAALRVIGTVAEPALSGRVTLREGGEVYLAGNRFHVSRGSISFTSPNRVLPEFDIELRTQVSGSDISLTLSGPMDRLETEVRSSDPNVDSRQAMSMLFGGFQGEDAVALLSSELLGATGRAIGLDTLRVERGFDLDEFRADPGLIATETDPSARLTIGKYLRSDVELILSQSLRESGGLSAIISYKPRRNIELRAVSRDNLDRSVALRHEITFGGATADPAAAASSAPRVSTVTISDDAGVPETELRQQLDLDVGDEFDFIRWQRDLDAIREVFHDRQHYEVRVHGSRQVAEDGQSVTLDYRIEPGPRAELVIEGHPLEPELEQEIREAWMRTIFDRFLLEDIRTRIQRHLVAENVVGSTVDATIAATTPELKQIRVVIKAGTAVERRVIAYEGNSAFDASQLDSVIEGAGLGVDGWLTPARIAEALTDFYRGEGYLAVTVQADPSVVQGSNGVLPVTIDEGRRFVISTIALAGVSPARRDAVVEATQFVPGAPFVAAELDRARERIEALFAREGFNTMQIEVETEPDPESRSVAITFAVLEGLQQVLRDVTTAGVTRTREGVIRRALRLRLGEPVNLGDWSQARKRLYDTNVFRQVDIEPVPIAPTTEDSAAGIQPVRAVVRVVEYPVWRLRYGVQLNDEKNEVVDPTLGDMRQQNLGVLADLQNQNVFGRAITAGIAGRYERNRQAGSLFTSNGSFFGLPIRSSGFIFTSRQRFLVDGDVRNIDERIGLTAEQRWRPSRRSELIWSYRFERTHTFDPDPSLGDDIPLDEVVKASRLNVAMLLDRRDDPSDPTRGWFSSANWEQSLAIFGAAGTGKLLLQQSVYRALGGVTFAARAQIGTGFGTQSLIVSERFLLGGATTVRGYGENTLGPTDPEFGLPGGDALLNLNGELRFPVRGWVQGVGFVDAGNVFAKRSDLSLRDLFVGYGVGLRLVSPYATLRVDFGVPANTTAGRPANQWRSGRWYFGIGHIF
jgi:outer membrane protein assembly complex protein YaeT